MLRPLPLLPPPLSPPTYSTLAFFSCILSSSFLSIVIISSATTVCLIFFVLALLVIKFASDKIQFLKSIDQFSYNRQAKQLPAIVVARQTGAGGVLPGAVDRLVC